MINKRVKVKNKDFKNQFGYERDYRATVGSLKRALDEFDDDLPIGVLYDTGFAYCDIYEIILEDGLVKLVGD